MGLGELLGAQLIEACLGKDSIDLCPVDVKLLLSNISLILSSSVKGIL